MRPVNELKTIVVMGMLVLLSGCGGNYNAEKMFWQIRKNHNEVLINTEKVSEDEFKAGILELEKLTTRFPGWAKAAEIQFRMGEMYVVRKDFQKAREAIKKVIINYPEKTELCARARFTIGKLNEKDGEWEKALVEYNIIIERFPNTFTGLQIPLYIADYYQKNRLKKMSKRSYEKAVRFYQNIIDKNPYSRNVSVVHKMMALAYSKQKKWKEFVGVLQKFAQKYPDAEAAPEALYSAAAIYSNALGKSDKAEEIYRKITEKYPKSERVKDVILGIGNLFLKEGNIDAAREEYERIRQMYPKDASLNAAAQLTIAYGYEKAGNFESAIEIYNKVEKEYPQTVEAILVPMLVAESYKKAGNDREAGKALNSAITKYRAVIEGKPNDRILIISHELIARIYYIQQNWEEAVAALNYIQENYPKTSNAALALLKKALIYEGGLKDQEKANNVYLSFVEKYPKNKFAAIARQKLEKSKRNESK